MSITTHNMSVTLKMKSLRMPLFGYMFSPKKTPPRKSATLSSLHTVSFIRKLTDWHFLNKVEAYLSSVC